MRTHELRRVGHKDHIIVLLRILPLHL